ncbi:MAG: tRNA lysidine(34) synthetase TilS [Candidatus Omnitrophica bacterium]|jgi:tRNA(Ile)-lysidine synthase|nr:tRNA lysidine(34) synthetase TilS [Candidatus Omnitrophota bacterium]
MLKETFINTVKQGGLLKKKDKVILGVSGGPDSMCLLYLFLQIKKEYRLQLLCAHFNHSLREESDSEEEFIRKICENLNLEFVSEKKDVKSFLKGDSLEQTARNLRLDFFLKCSRQTKIKKIALAHHKDDLAETILMRLIKGTGLRGLRGFSSKSKYKNLTVIRPLIELRKKEILNWLDDNRITYCIDKSNLEDKFLRNKIRLKLMPFLEEINPNISDNLYNLARNLALDYDFIYSFSYDKFIVLRRRQNYNSIRLDLQGLKGLPLAIFNNVIRIAVEQFKGNTRRLEAKHLREIRDLLFKRPQGSIVDLPGFQVKKDNETLVIQSLIL